MKRINRKKRRSGSALAMVLMFMTLMVVLGTGVLIAAQYSTQQSVAIVQADRHYYSAESAAQLATQQFLGEFASEIPDNFDELEDVDVGFFRKKEGITEAELPPGGIDQYVEDMKQDLLDNITSAYARIAQTIANDMEFNGEKAELGADLGLTIDDIDGDGGEVGEVKEVEGVVTEDITYTAAVWVKEPNFKITVTSGGRTVTVETNAEVDVQVSGVDEIANEYTIPGIPGYLTATTGAYYKDTTGGIYGTSETASEKGTSYGKFHQRLEKLLDTTLAKGTATKTNIIPSSASVDDSHTSNSASISTDAKYAKGTNGLTLGVAGSTAPIIYPNLEYIEVTNNALNVVSPVICPKLKGVWVVGNINVKENAAINPMKVEGGKVTDTRKPNNGNNGVARIYSSGWNQLTITCNAEVNWCEFYAQQIRIENGSGNMFVSNSIFYPRSSLYINVILNPDVRGVIPQFYLNSTFPTSNTTLPSTGLSGIFMKAGDLALFNTGGGTGGTYKGLFVGNCINRVNGTVQSFSNEDLVYLMSGGIADIILSGDEPSTPDINVKEYEVGVDVNYTFNGINIRETTGET